MPIVKITEAEPIKVGKGKSRELKFEIIKWVPRPAAIVEALAKLKAANASPNKSAATNGAANTTTAATISTTKTSRTSPKKRRRRSRKGDDEEAKRRAEEGATRTAASSDILDDPNSVS